MRKCQFLLVAVVLVFCLEGCAGPGSVKPIKKSDVKAREEVSSELKLKRDFAVNKKFIFNIAWNGIPVGRVTAESGSPIDYRGRSVYVVRITTESNEFLSRIYRVEDTYTSYVDEEDMTSRRFEADRKEGRYRKHVIVEYDFDRKEAVYTNLVDGSVKTCSIREGVHDPVSAACRFMTLPIKEGEQVNICVNLNEKNYDLYGRAEGYGVVKLPGMGQFKSFKIRPYVYLEGKEYEKGRAWMYFSTGVKRYPLYGVVMIPFGKVTATLERVEDI